MLAVVRAGAAGAARSAAGREQERGAGDQRQVEWTSSHRDDPFSAGSRSLRSHSRRAAGPLEPSSWRIVRQSPRLARPMPPRHFLTGAELTAAELDALLDRAIELKAAPLLLAGARRAERRADLPEAIDPHAAVVRGRHRRAGRPSRRAARRRAAALARRVAARHRPRALPACRRRGRAHRARCDARGAGASTARSPSSTCSPRGTIPARRWPTCSRCARRSARLRGAAPRLRRRRQQRRALARAARHARRAARRGGLAARLCAGGDLAVARRRHGLAHAAHRSARGRGTARRPSTPTCG